ncbi:MAG: glycosyltransferase [Candidatus Binatia bacterium]
MSQRIRVLYFIGTLEIGGTEGQLVELVKRLDRQRFEPVVCCLFSGGPYVSVLSDARTQVEIMNFPDPWTFSRPHMVLKHFFGLVKYIGRMRPHVVHGFLFWAYVIGTIAACAARVPVIVSSRRSLGHFKAGRSFYLCLERIVNSITRVVVANSEAVRQDVIRQEKLPTGKVLVIHNGLDPSRFVIKPNELLRESLGLRERSPLIGVIANVIYYKGHSFFLDAWARILDKCPDAIALLVGDGPLKEDVEAKVDAIGLSESARFLGTRHDIPELLALMDILVHPSLEEGFSNAILEAMAAGKPVVATDVGGNPEAVIHGETGLLVPPRDPAALADAVAELFSDPRRADQMGKAGRERVEKEFRIDRMVHSMEKLYEELVDVRLTGKALR